MQRRSCIRCSGKEFEGPEFTVEEKVLLTNLKRQNKFFEVMEEINASLSFRRYSVTKY